MEAIVCDRCKVVLTGPGKTGANKIKFNRIKWVFNSWADWNWRYKHTHELCPSCVDDFEKFLKGENNEL